MPAGDVVKIFKVMRDEAERSGLHVTPAVLQLVVD
jgi:hypothetical protein